MREEAYLPLEDYGLVGDGRGSALVSRDGSIDWLCVPRFDSPSLFGRILDHERGGFWQLAPAAQASSTFAYRDRTAILETEHRTSAGLLRVSDCFLPAFGHRNPATLLRVCEGLAGEVELETVVEPGADFGRASQLPSPWGEDGWLLASPNGDARLRFSIGQQDRQSVFTLRQGDHATFVLEWGADTHRLSEGPALLEQAAADWQSWAGQIAYRGPYADMITRSALTLRLLTHDPNGALVSAPTTSLPAVIGGGANWDYRYTWLRDSSLALYALLALGVRDEADSFFDWICARVRRSTEKGLHVMYDVDGGFDHEEQVLPHLEGYRCSRPVRVGNAACTQVQLDVYGEVLDVFSTACEWGREDKLERWEDFRLLADWVCDHWEEPDSGIWEQRTKEHNYVYSKVMAWVALNRARRVAGRHSLSGDLERWAANEQAIRATVFGLGWNEQLGAFKQSFDDDRVDAANLLIPLVGFIPPDDPRAHSNLARIRAELETEGLVSRFRPRENELAAGEGAFALCSFWLVNALAAAGLIDEAAETFERCSAQGSPLGLFAEHVGIPGGGLQGNYPQAFVHAAALTAAVNLARSGRGEAPAAESAPEGTAHLIPLATGRGSVGTEVAGR